MEGSENAVPSLSDSIYLQNGGGPLVVKAKYTFSGKNNDEVRPYSPPKSSFKLRFSSVVFSQKWPHNGDSKAGRWLVGGNFEWEDWLLPREIRARLETWRFFWLKKRDFSMANWGFLERHLRAKSPAGVRNVELSLLPSQTNKTVYRNIVSLIFCYKHPKMVICKLGFERSDRGWAIACERAWVTVCVVHSTNWPQTGRSEQKSSQVQKLSSCFSKK